MLLQMILPFRQFVLVSRSSRAAGEPFGNGREWPTARRGAPTRIVDIPLNPFADPSWLCRRSEQGLPCAHLPPLGPLDGMRFAVM